jgi:hypothetical protein
VAGVAQLAIGDQRAFVLDKAMGAAVACDFLSHRVRIVHLRKERGEVFVAVEVPESGDEGGRSQLGKRRGIGEGGRA